MYAIFSSNYEAFASESLEYLEEMFPMYYMRSDTLSMFQPHTEVSVKG